MTQRKYVPKHENPLGYGFEEFLLSDMSREELADRFLTAKEELSEARAINRGSRLCYKSRELAEYAATQFADIYNDFLTIK